MMVRVSMVPPASMYMLIRVGTCTAASLRRWMPLILEPSVHIQFLRVYLGVQWCGVGGAFGGRRDLVIPPYGRLDLFPMEGRVYEDLNPLFLWSLSLELCDAGSRNVMHALIVAIAHEIELRFVLWSNN